MLTYADTLRIQVGLNYKRLDQSDNTHIAELGKKPLEFMPTYADVC
jgi:hypothetical protein